MKETQNLKFEVVIAEFEDSPEVRKTVIAPNVETAFRMVLEEDWAIMTSDPHLPSEFDGIIDAMRYENGWYKVTDHIGTYASARPIHEVGTSAEDIARQVFIHIEKEQRNNPNTKFYRDSIAEVARITKHLGHQLGLAAIVEVANHFFIINERYNSQHPEPWMTEAGLGGE